MLIFVNLVIFRSPRKQNTLFHFKDTLDKKIRSNITYRYACSNCKITYHGKTYRHPFTGVAEHMSISNFVE